MAIALTLGVEPGRSQTYANFVLTPVADTFIDGRYVTQSYGGQNQTEVNAFATGDARAAYRFDLSSIPSGSRIVTATFRPWVTNTLFETISVYRATATWSEASTWSTTAGFSYNTTVLGSFSPTASGRFYDIAVTSAAHQWFTGAASNFGIVLVQPNGNNNAPARFTTREWATAAQQPQLVLVTLPPPLLTAVRSSTVVSDPINGAVNPKRVPGAVISSVVRWENRSSGYPDANALTLTETVPTMSSLFVGDLGAAGSGPVAFTQGSPTSAATFTYSNLASTTDDIAFSNDLGVTFNYVPTPDASGYDASVTHYRITPKGTFAGEAGAGFPSFTLSTRRRLK